MKEYHVYVLNPIDDGWEFCKTVPNVISDFCDEIKKFNNEGHWCLESQMVSSCLNQFILDYSESLLAAKRVGHWDGEMRRDPVVIPIPSETCCEYGFMWKQDNKGTTFAVMPVKDDNLLYLSYDYGSIKL